MTDTGFILDLGKLTIAASWADGDLSNEEVNCLKDLLFGLDDVSGEDWKVLEMYMESPVTAEETRELLERVVGGMRNSGDRELVIEVLHRLFSCDGEVSSEEKQFLDEINQAVSGVATGLLGTFTRAVKSAIRRRENRVRATCLREAEFEDYLENTVYYFVQQEADRTGVVLELPEEKLRKLCFATGLFAEIANTDSVSDREQSVIREILVTDWGISEQHADVLMRVSCSRAARGLDRFRLAQGFFEVTTFDERRDFLVTLFRIANVSGKTSSDEIEEIRSIAKCLKVPHKDFIDAKLTVPREDRNGL